MTERSTAPKQKTEKDVIDQVGRITSKLVDRAAALTQIPRHGDYSVARNGDTDIVATHRAAGSKRAQIAVITSTGSHETAASYEYGADGVEKKYTGAFVTNPGDEQPKHLGDIDAQIPEQTAQFGDKLNTEDGSAVTTTAHNLATIHEAVVQAERRNHQ